MQRNILLALFLVFGLFYVFLFDFIDSSLKMVFKLIPMILLIILAFMTKAKNIPRYYTLVCIGLIFCAIGDYTLQWFIIGLISFLIGHIFYIFAFRTTNESHVPGAVKIGLLLYGAFMIVWIAGTLFKNEETVLGVAVCCYIAVILTMGWTAFRTGSRFAIIGAMLFISSDSVLAINKFIVDVPFSHELIMFTYYGAQLFIALSITQYAAIRSKMVQ
ncbi:lysoplasmalogenase [Solibacillus sp. FSL H8-0538]|uniref:lysoplasmalogenase n=1 Tax=Solibacillus sp. FSL H8-0538 TaxID=2921400 RepID=UPI0030F8E6D7